MTTPPTPATQSVQLGRVLVEAARAYAAAIVDEGAGQTPTNAVDLAAALRALVPAANQLADTAGSMAEEVDPQYWEDFADRLAETHDALAQATAAAALAAETAPARDAVGQDDAPANAHD